MGAADMVLMLAALGSVVAFAIVYWRTFLRSPENRPLTAAARQRAVQEHALRQQIAIVHEQLRLNIEVDRCLRELRVEIAQDRARRQREAER